MGKWWKTAAVAFIIATLLRLEINVGAMEKLAVDESIYDVLVDRFFNATGGNDFEVNAKDPTQYAGGDFSGLISKVSFIQEMGFTVVSIGTIFDATTYDGRDVLSYQRLEEHFGTEEEFKQLINTYEKAKMKIMIDFPLGSLSSEHEWFTNGQNKEWQLVKEEGIAQLDLTDAALQEKLENELMSTIEEYNLQAIRLTKLGNASEQWLNELIQLLKQSNEELLVITNEQSTANFDAKFYEESEKNYRNIFKSVDENSEAFMQIFEEEDTAPPLVMIDHLQSDRFIVDVEKQGMYPPTRMKMALGATLLLPGIPLIQYGSEIVMNGEKGTAAHQLYNFKTETDIIDYVKNMQTLRNDSETLRKGEFTLLKNEDGYIVFERKSSTEQWIVVINNSSKTKSIHLEEGLIGQNKELRGMFESEVIRENKIGEYSIVTDREIVEVYQVIEARGFNLSYIFALAAVFIVYTIFVISLMKRGKKKRALETV